MMKETKLLGKENNNEEEKTKFEQIEEELKSSVFSVFYLLLKNQETTFWKFIILLIVEYLQLLSFSFDTSVRDSNILNGNLYFWVSLRVILIAGICFTKHKVNDIDLIQFWLKDWIVMNFVTLDGWEVEGKRYSYILCIISKHLQDCILVIKAVLEHLHYHLLYLHFLGVCDHHRLPLRRHFVQTQEVLIYAANSNFENCLHIDHDRALYSNCW